MGSAACHESPRIVCPEGRTGPSLVDCDDFGPIAGSLPNIPPHLTGFMGMPRRVYTYLPDRGLDLLAVTIS